MHYALLFYNPPQALESKPAAEREAWYAAMEVRPELPIPS